MKRTRLDIRDWEAFASLVRLRHFGRAAEELGVTQSAISQRISKLEADLGLKLLIRSTMGVEPTDAGAALLPQADALLAAKLNALEAAAAVRKNGARPVRLTLANAIIHAMLLPRLRKALEEGVGSGFHVDVETADKIEAKVLSGAFDLAITTLPVSHEELRQDVLTELPMGVAVPCETDLETVSMAELARNPVLTAPRHTAPELYDSLISAASRAGRTLRLDRPVVAFPSIVAMVAMGAGWGLVPLAMTGTIPEGAKVLPLDLPDPLHIRILIAWRADNARADPVVAILRSNESLLH